MPITSSSISSSEPGASAAGEWLRFCGLVLLSALVLVLALWAGLVALDPYDTGHWRPAAPSVVLREGSRTGGASRGRDPAFDGALIGNSHLQLISPEALTGATGIPFVSLTVTATGPKEQMAVLDWFLSHRLRPVRALVIGTDDFWCTDQPDHAHWEPFPFWLYDRSPWRYAAGLFRYSSFDAALRRLTLRGSDPRNRRDGYANFELDPRWADANHALDLTRPKLSPFLGRSGAYPALDLLEAKLKTLPAEARVVLVRPPVFRPALPQPGSDAARAEAACLARVERLAASRPRTTLVDWRRPVPGYDDPVNFFDHDHYRGVLARNLEQAIASALR